MKQLIIIISAICLTSCYTTESVVTSEPLPNASPLSFISSNATKKDVDKILGSGLKISERFYRYYYGRDNELFVFVKYKENDNQIDYYSVQKKTLGGTYISYSFWKTFWLCLAIGAATDFFIMLHFSD